MSDDAGVVIVGAGLAGVTAAVGLRRRGYDRKIALVNEEQEIPYDRPPLSKDVLAGDRSLQDIALHPAPFYEEQEIALLSGTRVRGIDRGRRTLTLEDGQALSYGKLILASGARPRRLPPPMTSNGVLTRLFYLRDFQDSMALRAHLAPDKHVLVVGAGFIGLEVAACARGIGCRVTVVEAGQRVLERSAPHEVSRFVHTAHKDNEVEFLFGAQVQQVWEGEHTISVRLADGEVRTADVVLVGIGAVPNDDLARAAGLPCDNGIVVDAQCRTNDPDVFAVGDVAKGFNPFVGQHIRLEHWDSARQTGEVTAATICGEPAVNDGLPWVWSDQYGVNLQFLGWSDPRASKVMRGAVDSGNWSLIEVLDGQVIGAVLVNSGRERRPLERLIRSRTTVDTARLADTSVALKQWAA
jgi:NADPH-dependent 2,4-dienoyl-CoA reductase/sulfur reductase-like enzyme